MTTSTMTSEWAKYLEFFTEQNTGRPTRLGVFEQSGDSMIDYWLESGLPFTAVDIDSTSDGVSTSILLLVGEMEHVIKQPHEIKFILSRAGDEDGIDITDSRGRTTVLRFEGANTH